VVSTTAFTVVYSGKISLAGLTDGAVYFLSASSAGALTATEPNVAGQVSKPVLIAIGTGTGIVVQMRGAVIGGMPPLANGKVWQGDANGVAQQVSSLSSSMIAGTTTNDDATAGKIGEYLSSWVGGGAIPGASAVWGNITNVTLTAGDWSVWGGVMVSLNGATGHTYCEVCTSTYSGTAVPDTSYGLNRLQFPGATASAANGSALPPWQVKVANGSTVAVYLKVLADFTGGTKPLCWGSIVARRVR